MSTSKVKGQGHQGQTSSPLKMHCNALAANNVKQQQTEPLRRCRGWWECTDSQGFRQVDPVRGCTKLFGGC